MGQLIQHRFSICGVGICIDCKFLRVLIGKYTKIHVLTK